jgi:hypothetical protein
MTFHVTGIDADQLAAALDDGLDHAQNLIEPFVDDDGGWPLRCCLGDSAPGDEIAIIAWSPFPWKGAYAETGPVVIHTANCPGAPAPKLSDEFDIRPMVLRPYGFNQRIAYHRVRHVNNGASLSAHLEELLAEADVDFVHGRNVTGGCYAFTATRVEPLSDPN